MLRFCILSACKEYRLYCFSSKFTATLHSFILKELPKTTYGYNMWVFFALVSTVCWA